MPKGPSANIAISGLFCPELLARNRTEYATMPYPAHGSLLFSDVGVLLLTCGWRQARRLRTTYSSA